MCMDYGLAIVIGFALAWLVRRLQPPETGLVRDHRGELFAAAGAGAVAGAFLGDLPAGWYGWDGLGDDGHRLGGRTILGGLLGGWLAVEAVKRIIGLRQPTGDGFAAPLAIACAFGRVGCLEAGCCGPPWVTSAEMAFHASACAILLIMAWRGMLPGRRLAAFLTCYAALRIVLEAWRGHPVIALGVTWYQMLAIALLLLAGATWIMRSRRGLLEPVPSLLPPR